MPKYFWVIILTGLEYFLVTKSSINEENKYYWNGNIGLLNLSDCAKANNEGQNYLAGLYRWYWLMNPDLNSRTLLRSRRYGIEGYGSVYYGSGSQVGLVPSFYLKADIRLTGDGTESNPYQIL